MIKKRPWFVEALSQSQVCNFRWKPTSNGINFENLSQNGRVMMVNHLENHSEITQKSKLYQNLKVYCRVFHFSLHLYFPTCIYIDTPIYIHKLIFLCRKTVNGGLTSPIFPLGHLMSAPTFLRLLSSC